MDETRKSPVAVANEAANTALQLRKRYDNLEKAVNDMDVDRAKQEIAEGRRELSDLAANAKQLQRAAGPLLDRLKNMRGSKSPPAVAAPAPAAVAVQETATRVSQRSGVPRSIVALLLFLFALVAATLLVAKFLGTGTAFIVLSVIIVLTFAALAYSAHVASKDN